MRKRRSRASAASSKRSIPRWRCRISLPAIRSRRRSSPKPVWRPRTRCNAPRKSGCKPARGRTRRRARDWRRVDSDKKPYDLGSRTRRSAAWRCTAGPGHKIAKTTPCKVECAPVRSTLACAASGARGEKWSVVTAQPNRTRGTD